MVFFRHLLEILVKLIVPWIKIGKCRTWLGKLLYRKGHLPSSKRLHQFHYLPRARKKRVLDDVAPMPNWPSIQRIWSSMHSSWWSILSNYQHMHILNSYLTYRSQNANKKCTVCLIPTPATRRAIINQSVVQTARIWYPASSSAMNIKTQCTITAPTKDPMRLSVTITWRPAPHFFQRDATNPASFAHLLDTSLIPANVMYTTSATTQHPMIHLGNANLQLMRINNSSSICNIYLSLAKAVLIYNLPM